MKNKKQIIWGAVAGFLLVLIGFFRLFQGSATSDTAQSVVSDDSTSSKSQDKSTSVSKVSTEAAKHIAISSGCIGCGHCARFDPEHFGMSGRSAAVLSNDNLDSNNLSVAISRCPVGAISLNS